ncbi:MAG: YggS family pyridoxal phosphate-dependent enzyme [Micavibrio aeruginosavorus]|uniref:Pyridoxal phosphate homeostasis protein n=1 Tax=Micavibrio aeruginosavorus TaxID=349221 RepID=A0A2W5BQ72_9BACT|nr:MAG: YggS family pyridoxal phosphate-dependent enzyme [Micavibrio aeruginosavorus]
MSIAENFEKIRHKIRRAEKEAGRAPESCNLVAVSKMQSAGTIRAALDTGHRLFGENRVQEAQEHWKSYRDDKAYHDLQLHLIGPLQTNKVDDALALFDCIETIDREKLAKAIANALTPQSRTGEFFVQVNTGQEEQKAGIDPLHAVEFVRFCRNDCGLNITGLMCIPPVEDAAALHFALLKKLAGQAGLQKLSMGMSSDFEKAIMLGATHVRVGTALFGERDAA